MDATLRLLIRVILVPLGYIAAVTAATAVIAAAAWQHGSLLVTGTELDAPEFALMSLLIGASVLFTVLLAIMWLPASIGVVIAEAFAIRSWLFHAANGAASAWAGWLLFNGIEGARILHNEPLVVVAAGLAGGLAYWAVAGWSAGFWKPVYRGAAPSSAVPQSATPR